MKLLITSLFITIGFYSFSQADDWNLSTPGQITTLDKVGIGTNSPDMQLSIYSSEDKIVRFHHSGSAVISGFRSGRSGSFGDFVNLSNGLGIGAGTSSGNLPLSTQNSNHIDLFIDNSTNNIGIGTVNPGAWFSGKVLEISNNRPVLKLNSTGDLVTILLTDSNVDPVSHTGEFHWNYRYNDASPNKSTVAFHAYPAGTVLGIQADGKVGIGNNTPKETLDVSGNIRFGKTYVTDINLVSDTHGGAHALLFNAYKSTNANGWLSSETNYSNPEGAYGGGAGGIVFYGNGGTMDFWISPASSGTDNPVSWGAPKMRINRAGEVGIGTTDVDGYRLSVGGSIRAEEIKVEATPWPDYVFEEDYELRSLEETEAYIQENKHLPEIPSAKEMEANGVALGEMNRLLLQKIEELTLHVIELKKENQAQQKEIEKLKSDQK